MCDERAELCVTHRGNFAWRRRWNIQTLHSIDLALRRCLGKLQMKRQISSA
jgi:hypothetical protein